MEQNGSVQENCVKNYSEEVCVNVQKIYDTCKDKDCLSDLRVYFSSEDQALIDRAINIRPKGARIVRTLVDLDAVPFNRGYYAVDIKFFFVVDFEVFTGCGRPTLISGLASYDKKVILFGGEGSTTTFTSADPEDKICSGSSGVNNLPVAQVEIVEPIVLGTRMINPKVNCCCCETDIMSVPSSVCSLFENGLSDCGEKYLAVTLGLFSIVRIVRDTQILIPSARFCLPEKQCKGPTEEEPCSFFERLSFPTGEFFPQDVSFGKETCRSCGCGESKDNCH